jgi:hypothetical protein
MQCGMMWGPSHTGSTNFQSFFHLTPTTLFFLPCPQNVLETPNTLNSSHLQVWVVCYVHGSLLIMKVWVVFFGPPC